VPIESRLTQHHLLKPAQNLSQIQPNRPAVPKAVCSAINTRIKEISMAQIALETTSDQSTEEIIARAKKTFVEEYGLEIIEEAECCLRLEGGGGFVYIRTEPKDEHTKVILEGMEWSRQLKDFMKQVAS
jgi:hypothetical protein